MQGTPLQDLSTYFLVFCCFDVKEPNCFCLLQPTGKGKEERGRERKGKGGEGRGGAGSPEAWWCGHSGLGPSVGFARLATRLLPHGFQSQVAGDCAAGSLGRFQAFWGLQDSCYVWETGFLGKGFSTSVRVCPGETGVVRDGFPEMLRTSARVLLEMVIVVGGHE